MLEVVDTTLSWTFEAPLFAALVLFAADRAPLLWTRLLIAVVAQGVAVGVAVASGMRALSRGGFALFDVDGWVGARLTDVDALGLVPCALPPSLVPVLVAVELAGLLATGLLLPHARRAMSSAPLAAALACTGMTSLLVVAASLEGMCAAFALTGVAGFALLVSFHPQRTDVEGAVRAFILHRIGDALLLVAVMVVLPSTPGLDDVLVDAPAVEPWARAAAGPFAGFAARETWSVAAALFAGAAVLRIACGPLVPVVRDAVGAPGPALGLAHGLCFGGAALVLLLRATPYLWLAPEVLTALGFIGAGGAVFSAVLAMSARDVVRTAITLLISFASLSLVALGAADLATSVLAATVLFFAAVPLCVTAAVVVEATGRADPHALGALEAKLPRTHTAAWLTTAGLFGPAFSGAVLVAHLLAGALKGPWLGNAVAGLVAAAAVLVGLAGFRPLQLIYTGRATRSALGRPVVDAPGRRTIPTIAFAIPLIALGWLLHIPPGFWQLYGAVTAASGNVVSYRSPLDTLVLPELAALHDVRTHVLPLFKAPPVQPATVLGIAVVALALGAAASSLLYRGGPGRAHETLLGGPRARKLVGRIAEIAGSEGEVVRGVGEGAIRLSRMIATNLAPGFLDTLLRRLPALFGFVVGFVVRFIANGSAQRGIVVAVVVLVTLLWMLGGGGATGGTP